MAEARERHRAEQGWQKGRIPLFSISNVGQVFNFKAATPAPGALQRYIYI